MDRKGITLIELVIAIIMGGIVILAMTCQFIAEENLRLMLYDQIEVTNDVSIIMHHITNHIRVANNIQLTPLAAGYVSSLSATIPGNIDIVYGLTPGNILEYTEGGGTAQPLSADITFFDPRWVPGLGKLTVTLTAQRSSGQAARARSSSLETMIQVQPF